MAKTNPGRQRRLIGEMLPIQKISEAGAKEKSRSSGRISSLHRWWATMPTNVSRITAYAALTFPPMSKEHEDVIHEMCDYDKSTLGGPEIRERVRKRIRKEYGDYIPKVLDTFGGSGALPFAAAWLGCESHSIDYNPVAVLIQKCALEYPAKYGKKLVDDVRNTAQVIEKNIREAVSKFYPDDKMGDDTSYDFYGYRWCRTIPCTCGVTIPLVKSYVTSKKRNIHLFPRVEGDVVRFDVVGGQYGEIPEGFDPKKGSIGNNVIKCVKCGHTYTNTEMHTAFSNGEGSEQMLVAAYTHPKKPGKFYRVIDNDDHTLYEQCADELIIHRAQFREEYGIDPVPSGIIPTPDGKEHHKGGSYWTTTKVVGHGYTRWEHLFNTRQLLCLVKILDILRRTEAHLIEQHGEEYGCAIISYMALMLSKTVEKYCRLSPWMDTELIRECFSSQTLKPTADYGEAAPHRIWQQGTKSVLGGLKAALSAADGSTYVVQMGSATNIRQQYDDEYFDAVCTDPPYYDSMHYSKQADFFYIWLKRSVGHLHKELFRGVTSPDKDEAVQTTGDVRNLDRTSSLVRNKNGYQNLMTKSLQEMYRVLKYDGILTLVYTHKSTDGWETLIQSMLDAEFTITAAWPIDTQSKSRQKSHGTASLQSSIYMVGRKWKKESKAYYRDVREELRARVCSKLDHFMKQGVKGADFYIAGIGASCEVYSKYESVVSDDTGQPVTVSDMLADIRKICSEHIVKSLTSGAAGNIDAMSKLYILWRWTYGDRVVPYDDARKLFIGVGLNIDDHVGTMLKKNGQDMTMLDYTKREEEIKPKNTIDILHKALQHRLKEEKGAMNELLAPVNRTQLNQIVQAIIDAAPKTAESRVLASFLAVRKSDVPGSYTGPLDVYT